MELDPGACYRALRTHDVRFDGIFFTAVTSTGIYCRPICPARVPAAARCRFFARAAEAERAGFRACFRCRPELAPGVRAGSEPAAVDAVDALVRSAAAHIEAGYLNDASVEDLAGELGVTARHLRRSVEARLGVTPIELAQTCRLAVAKHLLQDGSLPLAQVAFASGFSSVRRFNALFRERFGRAPTAVRLSLGTDRATAGPAGLHLRLDYRPPLAWEALLAFLGARAIPGVEQVVDGEYRRTVTLGDHRGVLSVRHDPRAHTLRAELSLSLAPVVAAVVARLRALFDLDAQPQAVADHLRRDPRLAPLVTARPGLRVPGAFDGFEAAVRAVLGQQVSVAAATTLAGRVAERFGAGARLPAPEHLAAASLDAIRKVGLPAARARTLLELAQAVASGELRLTPDAPPTATMARLQTIAGIGPWTAHYIALRALHWPDAFPAGDLAVRKALGMPSVRDAEARAEVWRPWRAYAVIHLWTGA